MTAVAHRLKSLTESSRITGWLLAYGYSGLISCGPWVVSISALALTNSMVRNILPLEQRDLFSTTTTYAYALSLILTGPVQLILARYAGNLVAEDREQSLFPSALSSLTLVTLLGLAGAVPMFWTGTDLGMRYTASAIALTVLVSQVITAVIFLASYRQFHLIVAAFGIGYGVGAIFAVLAADRLGVPGVLFSFAFGHLVILLIALWGVMQRSGWNGRSWSNWEFLRVFGRLPALALAGLFYNLGIWSDKFLFWWLSDHSMTVNGLLRASPNYDVAIYLSLLSIIPGFAAMFHFLETRFSPSFHRFFSAVNHGGTLSDIREKKLDLMETIRSGFFNLLKIQGLTTLSLLIGVAPLAESLGIGALQQGIFSVTLIGTCTLLVFLFVLTILFYLNDLVGSLVSTATFFLVNAVISYFTLHTDEGWHGYGFLAASCLASFIAMVFANRACNSLEFRSFHSNQGNS